MFLRGHVLILHVLDQSLWSRYSAMIVILLDVIVQLGYFLIHLFLSDFYTSRLFLFACPPPAYSFYLRTYRSHPMQANKKSAPVLSWQVMLHQKPRKTGMMLTVSRALGSNGHGPIQYGLILEMLDMFLGWNNRRWLENIHS